VTRACPELVEGASRPRWAGETPARQPPRDCDPGLFESIMSCVRIDTWLWAARFFKTRTLAKRACELGRIESNGQTAKPARDVDIGDMLKITSEGGEFQVEVLLVSKTRGPASVAQTLYRETDASREMRQKLADERQAMRQFETLPQGRLSKRD